MAFLTCSQTPKPILFPDITYSFYPVYCDLYHIDFKKIALDKDFKINKEDYYIENGGIIFPNPNAPTGELVSIDFIEDILKHNQESVVVIDEAYIDFGGESVIPLLSQYDNLLIIQTFSKFRSLAGIRLGVALGNQEIISRLYDVKNSFNSYPVDRIAQVIGKASVEDSAYIKENAKRIINTRERISKELKDLGFEMTDSYSNFLFVKHPDFKGEYLFYELRKKGIVVRWFNSERIHDCLWRVNMKKDFAVIFDLDGTLLNTDSLIMETFQYVFKKYFPNYKLRQEELLSFLGPSLWETFSRYVSKDKVDELVECYKEYNHQHHENFVTIYPYVQETLEILKQRNYPLVIVTSKTTEAAYIGLDLFNISNYFDEVIGIDKVKNAKPDPEGILKALSMTNCVKGVMIGDNISDIKCGKNADIYTIGVKWSPKGYQEMEGFGVDLLIDDMSEIVKFIEEVSEEC